LPAPATQSLQSLVESVLAQARAAALFTAWRWAAGQDMGTPSSEAAPEEKQSEVEEVLSLCQTLEWQNSDLEALLRRQAHENARLASELGGPLLELSEHGHSLSGAFGVASTLSLPR